MTLTEVANAIDAQTSTIETQVPIRDAAQDAIESANTEIANLQPEWDIAIRDANTNGVGSITPGFLDAVGTGIVEFEFSNTNRRLNFRYDADLDVISDVIYTRRDRITGDL